MELTRTAYLAVEAALRPKGKTRDFWPADSSGTMVLLDRLGYTQHVTMLQTGEYSSAVSSSDVVGQIEALLEAMLTDLGQDPMEEAFVEARMNELMTNDVDTLSYG